MCARTHVHMFLTRAQRHPGPPPEVPSDNCSEPVPVSPVWTLQGQLLHAETGLNTPVGGAAGILAARRRLTHKEPGHRNDPLPCPPGQPSTFLHPLGGLGDSGTCPLPDSVSSPVKWGWWQPPHEGQGRLTLGQPRSKFYVALWAQASGLHTLGFSFSPL